MKLLPQLSNRSRKICPSHHPANSFTGSCTNLYCHNTTHADCNSSNLIYQLQCTEYDAFYIGETCHSLSLTAQMDAVSPPQPRTQISQLLSTQSHKIPFKDCWSVRIVHKLPAFTPTISKINLKLHANLSSNSNTFLV